MKDNNLVDDLNKSELFYYSNLTDQSNNLTKDEKQLSFQNIEPILKQEDNYHYLCPKCHIFPFIEFTKSKKYIIFTCFCYNNKEILIKDLFDENKNYITINNLSNTSILSSNNNIDYDNYEGLKCKEHNLNFTHYCKTCLLNVCEKCKYDCYNDFNKHEFIEIESILIDNKKINEIITKVNPNNQNHLINVLTEQNNNEIIGNIKLNPIEDNLLETVTEEEENEFN